MLLIENMEVNINSFILSHILLEDQFLYRQVARCIFGHNQLLLSYSGGLDSTVLLDIITTLIKLKYYDALKNTAPSLYLRAVHVHHGLSNQADVWANHCAQQCKIRNIPFHIIYINCCNYNKKKHNIEALARKLRYQELCQYLYAEETLLTAHHMNDQAETVLLALKRGSGPAGLSGINQNIVLYNNYRLLRPLLECSRAQLEAYAYRKKLIWVKDNTNIDVRFDRNFLRMQIIPLFRSRWPAFDKVVSRTAQLCRNQEILLNELLLESLNALIDLDGSLFFFPLLQYSAFKRQALLRHWLSNFFIDMPSYQLLQRIWDEVILSKIDAKPILNLGKYICRRFRKKLYILPIDMALSLNILPLSWSSSEDLVLLPYKLGLLVSQPLIVDVSSFQKTLQSHVNINLLSNIYLNYFEKSGKILTDCVVRAPESNEKVSIRFGHVPGLLYILNRDRGRKLKKIWQELNIPPWLRSRIPLLFYNNTLIAALGVFITQNGKAIITTNITNSSYSIWRVFWLQDVVYYKFFKNTLRYFLK